MFTKTVIISALAGFAVAAPTSIEKRATNIFQGVSLHSGSGIQASAINANGGHFFIGKDSSAYCPEGINGLDCSLYGNQTVFAFNPETKTLGLATFVPGGQQVYVASDGALAYTIPHSGYIPEGSSTSPFNYTAQSTSGTTGGLKFSEQSFEACPTDEEYVYQVYAFAKAASNLTDCIGFVFGTAEVESGSAYQY